MSVGRTDLGRAAIVPIVVAALLALSTVLGLCSLSGRLRAYWSPSSVALAEQQREVDLAGFLTFASERVPYGSTVLCVASRETPVEIWFHYRLSYELYPSTVWRVAPVAADTSATAWDAIVERARDKGAEYAVIYDLVMPPSENVSSLGEYRPGQSVVRFR